MDTEKKKNNELHKVIYGNPVARQIIAIDLRKSTVPVLRYSHVWQLGFATAFCPSFYMPIFLLFLQVLLDFSTGFHVEVIYISLETDFVIK